jgi:dihydrofolate reductase
MGAIHIDLFMTLDGVVQAPGGPREDTEGGFRFGGWQFPFFDETNGRIVSADIDRLDALLLGRKTYDIFAAYWPNAKQDGDIANKFNEVPKYVVSHGHEPLEWAGSERLGDDVVAEVRRVRDRHREVHVIGSANLVQTLLANELFDRLNLWVYPVLLGSGKQAFAGGTVPTNLKLVEPPVATSKGGVLLRYDRVEGTPSTGEFAADEG